MIIILTGYHGEITAGQDSHSGRGSNVLRTYLSKCKPHIVIYMAATKGKLMPNDILYYLKE